MKWTHGRQNTGYQKLKIFSFWRMDCYLIRYTEGCAVGYHTDTVPGKKHYRMNIMLKGIDRLCHVDQITSKPKRFRVFRADIAHSYGPTRENGLILSFGWIS